MASIKQQLQPKVEQPQLPQQPPKSKYRNISFGGSTPESKQRTQQTLQNLFPGKTPEEVAHVAGAPEGSHIHFRDFGDGNIHLSTTHPNLNGHFVIHKDDQGKTRLHIGRYDAKGPKGQMHQRFNDIVNNATNLGLHEITTVGSSDPHPITGAKDNGGYTWPRLGFNGQLPSTLFSKLSPELQSKITAAGPKDYHTLFKVGGASELQQLPESTHSLHFDLNENSPHRAAFNDYFRSKEQQRIAAPSANGGFAQSPTQQHAGDIAAPVANPTVGAEGSASTGAVTSGVPATSPESSAAARRASSLERLRSLGRFKRKLKAAKYAVAPEVSPVIKGTHLEHALHYIKDQALSSQAQQVAKSILYPPAGVDHHEHIAATIPALHKALKFEAHPLAKRYNWNKVASGLALDHAVDHAANVIGAKYTDLTPYAAKSQALAEMFQHHVGMEGASPAAQDAVNTIKEHSNADHDDLIKSMERVYFRHHTKQKDPTEQNLKKIGVNPESDIAGTGEAHKFSRSIASTDFASAVQRLQSHLGETLVNIATRIHDKLQLKPHKVRKAVHDDQQGSIATTMQSVYHDDPDAVTTAAAHYGLLTETPSIAVFRTGEGEDFVHHFKVNGSGDKLRHTLNKYGLFQRVLVPNKNGYSVFVLDRKGTNLPLVKTAATALGGHLQSVKGTTEVIGKGDELKADRESRRDYRNVIGATNNG